jgi:hypothetical protein
VNFAPSDWTLPNISSAAAWASFQVSKTAAISRGANARLPPRRGTVSQRTCATGMKSTGTTNGIRGVYTGRSIPQSTKSGQFLACRLSDQVTDFLIKRDFLGKGRPSGQNLASRPIGYRTPRQSPARGPGLRWSSTLREVSGPDICRLSRRS